MLDQDKGLKGYVESRFVSDHEEGIDVFHETRRGMC